MVTGASASGVAPAGTAAVTVLWGSEADILLNLDSVNIGIREWERAEKRENCSLMGTSTGVGPCRTVAFASLNGMRQHTACTSRLQRQYGNANRQHGGGKYWW